MANTKKKGKSRNFFSYSEENLKLAIDAVTKNGMSRKSAAREFGVPRSTLIRKLALPTICSRRRMGPGTELSEKEDVIEKWVLAMARKGFPVHKNNLLLSVKKYIEDSGKETKYLLNKTPGRSWFQGFLKRHPNIKQKYAESLGKARAAVTQDKIESWFDEILTFLKEENYENILEDPSRIFNSDEAGFSLCPKNGKVLGPADNKEDFYVRVSSEKEQITVMATFSADGKYVPPMLIFPYKRVPQVIAESVPENWGLGRSDSGWMTSIVFYEYISNHFLPYLKGNNIQRPVLLFVDGHRSHLTKQVSQLCDENGIILVSLFPNTTHIMQPADVSVFRPLKAGWTSEVRKWKFENFPKEVTRHTFGTILNSVFEKYASEKTIQNGFRKSGLYPFDKNNVDYGKCIPNRKICTENRIVECLEKQTSENLAKLLESKIEKNILEQFYKTLSKNEAWSGDISYLKLFDIWAQVKTESESSTDNRLNISQPIKALTPANNSNVSTSDLSILDPCNVSMAVSSTSPDHLFSLVSSVAGPSHLISSSIIGLSVPISATSSPHPVNLDQPKHAEWCSPTKKNLYYYEEKENQGYKVPTPFKKCLVFPETPDKVKTPRQKRKIFPAVVSSGKYREFYENEMKKTKEKKAKRLPVKITIAAEETSSESDVEVTYEDEDCDLSDVEHYLKLETGKYVIIKYEGNYYPGEIVKHDFEGAEIRTMVCAGINSWKWPIKEDSLYYFREDIICIIKNPQVKNNRGHYNVPEMSRYI